MQIVAKLETTFGSNESSILSLSQFSGVYFGQSSAK